MHINIKQSSDDTSEERYNILQLRSFIISFKIMWRTVCLMILRTSFPNCSRGDKNKNRNKVYSQCY